MADVARARRQGTAGGPAVTEIRRLLRQTTLQPRAYPVTVALHRGILAEPTWMCQEQRFFGDNLVNDPALRFVTVERGDLVSPTLLCALSAQIAIDPLWFGEAGAPEPFSMAYDVGRTPEESIQSLPVYFLARPDPKTPTHRAVTTLHALPGGRISSRIAGSDAMAPPAKGPTAPAGPAAPRSAGAARTPARPAVSSCARSPYRRQNAATAPRSRRGCDAARGLVAAAAPAG